MVKLNTLLSSLAFEIVIIDSNGFGAMLILLSMLFSDMPMTCFRSKTFAVANPSLFGSQL